MAIKKPDILTTIQGLGVDLRQRGRSWWGCCPFHAEKTPSFMVDTEKQRWRCFGQCGEGGDVVDLTMKLKGISFREAVSLLRIPDGLRGNREHKVDPQKERRLVLSRAFGKWVSSTIRELSDEIWLMNTIDSLVTQPGNLEIAGLSGMYLDRECAEHWLGILSGDDFEAKLRLYRHMKEATGLCNIN